MRDCHLVAYRQAGFNPVAIASRSFENARSTGAKHGIERVHTDYNALLEDKTIEVLDIAVAPSAQADLILAACQRGTVKGILAQKPLGVHHAEAVELVRLCRDAGIILAVNQNMRFDPSIMAARDLLQSDALGPSILATIEMRAIPHWMPWQADLGWVTLRIMSIHHLDTFRWLFGEPESIYCSVRPDPRTRFPHKDGICVYVLEYENGLRCVGLDDTWTGPAKEGCPSDNYIRWRIEGLSGIAIGDIGWCKDPYTSPSTVKYARIGDSNFTENPLPGSWFPDAFAGTMGELLRAIEKGVEPSNSGADNLKTMALVDAAYKSAKEKRAISLSEMVE